MINLRKKSPRGCWVVGHRGAMGHAPENTMSSFRTGLAMGADLLECDVHLSRDGKCVVIHDERVNRTTDGRGLIRDLNSAGIKGLDAGSWYSRRFKGERVPLLRGLLSWARDQVTSQGVPLSIIIEIKNDRMQYEKIEEKVIGSVREEGMEDRVILISFDHEAVKRAKRVDKDIATGMLFSDPMKDLFRRAADIKADSIFPRRHLVTKTLIEKAHREGLFVGTWTVNETKEMKKLLACHVDAMATNFPDRLSRLIMPK